MKEILYFIGCLWIALGAYVILYTDNSRNLIKKMLTGFSLKIGATIACVTGVLLLFAGTATEYPTVIYILGGIAVTEGLFLFFNPKKLADKFLGWYVNKASDTLLRLHGILAIIIGTVVFSWVR